jgi:hypothetical protein
MDQQGSVKGSAKPLVNRRTVALGAAWSVPVIVLATAAPAAAASAGPAVADAGGNTFTRTNNPKVTTFTAHLTASVATTITVTLITPNDGAWVTPYPGPLSLAGGANELTFVVDRGNNSDKAKSYTIFYDVAGGSPSSVTATRA